MTMQPSDGKARAHTYSLFDRIARSPSAPVVIDALLGGVIIAATLAQAIIASAMKARRAS